MNDWPQNRFGKFACPCCGYHTLSEYGGKFDICDVCGWEEDCLGFWPTDLAAYEDGFQEGSIWDMRVWGSANHMTVLTGRANFEKFRASSERRREWCRPPAEDELPRHDWHIDIRPFISKPRTDT
jgi:cysteine-rich CPCC protein